MRKKRTKKRKNLFSRIQTGFFANYNRDFIAYHIVPWSRINEIIYHDYLNKVGRKNTSKIPKIIHDDFRRLFPSLSPPEVLAILVTKFWRGQIHWLNKYMKEPEKYNNCSAVKNFYNQVKNNSNRKPHNRDHTSIHHIVPSSRLGELEYFIYDGKLNTTVIPRNLHDYYHWLFINLTPPEIAAVLVSLFWQNQIFWIKLYLGQSYFFNKQVSFVT